MKVASLVAVFRALNAAEVRYIVVGGIAVIAHGYGRNTEDVDLVVNLAPKQIVKTFTALGTLGYQPRVPVTAEQFADAQLRQSWIDEKGMVVLNMYSDEHRETRVDLFVKEPFDFEREYAGSKRYELAPGLSIPIVRLDALFTLKESAGRPQDIADLSELRQIHQQDG